MSSKWESLLVCESDMCSKWESLLVCESDMCSKLESLLGDSRAVDGVLKWVSQCIRQTDSEVEVSERDEMLLTVY